MTCPLDNDSDTQLLRGQKLSQWSMRSAKVNDMTIQMDIVPSVAVEVDKGVVRDPRLPDPTIKQDAVVER